MAPKIILRKLLQTAKYQRYKSQHFILLFEFHHVGPIRYYSQLAYEDLSLDLKFVASRYASGPVMQSRICPLWGSAKVDEEGKKG